MALQRNYTITQPTGATIRITPYEGYVSIEQGDIVHVDMACIQDLIDALRELQG